MPETRTIFTSKTFHIRKDTNKRTSPAYAKANPKNVIVQYEPHSYEEKIDG